MRTAIGMALVLGVTATAYGQDHQIIGPHVHGSGTLTLAVSGNSVQIALHAPAADIIGFENFSGDPHAVPEVRQALERFADPLALFGISQAARCSVLTAEAGLSADHDAHGHDEEDHDDAHAEFEAEYELECIDTDQLGRMTLAYFDVFPGAERLDVQVVTDRGANRYEVEAEQPLLDMADLF